MKILVIHVSSRVGDSLLVTPLIETIKHKFKNCKLSLFAHKRMHVLFQNNSDIDDIDVILLDPPRTGAGKLVIDQIASKKPRTIVYVSCDPASLARDSRFLEDSGYSLDKITAIDLFPMTHHIECIVKFVRKTN